MVEDEAVEALVEEEEVETEEDLVAVEGVEEGLVTVEVAAAGEVLEVDVAETGAGVVEGDAEEVDVEVAA